VYTGVNDSLEHAAELADLLQGRPLLMNLRPYNANITAEIHGFKGPTEEAGRAFGRYGPRQYFVRVVYFGHFRVCL
jgi:adenine C2-methylase RlmN of 23S rRNA A2503 and tRNA A37